MSLHTLRMSIIFALISTSAFAMPERHPGGRPEIKFTYVESVFSSEEEVAKVQALYDKYQEREEVQNFFRDNRPAPPAEGGKPLSRETMMAGLKKVLLEIETKEAKDCVSCTAEQTAPTTVLDKEAVVSAVAVTQVSAHVLTKEDLDRVKAEIRTEVLAEVKAEQKKADEKKARAAPKERPEKREDEPLSPRSGPKSKSSETPRALALQGQGASAIDVTSYAKMTSVLESLLSQNERALLNLNSNTQMQNSSGMNMMNANSPRNMMEMNSGMNMMGMNSGMNMMGMNSGMNMMGLNSGMNMMGMNRGTGLNFGFQVGAGAGVGMPTSYQMMGQSMPYASQNYYNLGTSNSLYGSSYGNSSLASSYFGLGQGGATSLYGTGTNSAITAGQRQSIAGMVTY